MAEGNTADLAKLQRVVQAMADLLAMSLGLVEKDAFYPTILTREGHDIPLPQPIRHLCFSGGVADYIYHSPAGEDVFRYGDVGILLGQAIASSPAFPKFSTFRQRDHSGYRCRATTSPKSLEAPSLTTPFCPVRICRF